MLLLGNRSKSRSIKLVTGLYLLIHVNFMQNKSQKQTFRWKNSRSKEKKMHKKCIKTL